MAELGSGAASAVAEYSYYPGGLNKLHAIIVSPYTYYAHSDAMGNVRALANSSGQVKRTYSYDEWGQLLSTSGDSLPFNNADRARWKGALWMGPELDLYYMRNRWYEPRTGRFLSEDPIGLDGGINPYVFAGGNPVGGSDPTGLMMDLPSNRPIPWCWSELCQQAWDGGGGGDWDGNGEYDFITFTERSWARLRCGCTYAEFDTMWDANEHGNPSRVAQAWVRDIFFWGDVRVASGDEARRVAQHAVDRGVAEYLFDVRGWQDPADPRVVVVAPWTT